MVFCHELPIVRQGILPVECSIAEFFIFLMNLQEEEESRSEILNILAVNTYHLRMMTEKHLEEVIEWVKMTIDRLCLSWCENRSIWPSFLDLSKEIFVLANLINSEDLLR